MEAGTPRFRIRLPGTLGSATRECRFARRAVVRGRTVFGVRPRHAFAAIALVCGVALATGAGLEMTPGGGPAAPPAVLLGVAHDDGVRKLVRVAPVSLRPLPGRRLRVQGPLEAWALSPDDRRLAAVTERASL